MKDRTIKIITAGFIAFIMIASTLGFVMNFSGEALGGGTVYYNGYNFKPLQSGQNGYSFKAKDIELRTNFLPAEVSNIALDPEIVKLIKGTPMVRITSNFSSNYSDLIAYSAFELNNGLKPLGVYTQTGFTEKNPYNTEVISCANATQFVPVLYFSSSDSLKIGLNSSCIIASSTDAPGFVKLKDRLIYGLYGVIG